MAAPMTSAEELERLSRLPWQRLQERMRGEVIVAGDARMVRAHKHFSARPSLETPAALIECAHVEDVRRALDFVRGNAAAFVLRSGGHCFADLSSSGSVVISLAPMRAVTPRGELAAVGPGALAGEYIAALADQGRAAPTGGCPLVAMGGFTLVGGFGFLGRLCGLGADQAVAFDAVTADGDVIGASATERADLFWALRGAGAAGFVIVTSMMLRTYAAAPLLSCHAAWPLSKAADALEAWQTYAPAADRDINLEIMLTAPEGGGQPCVARLYGVILGDERDWPQHVETVRTALGALGQDLALRRFEPEDGAKFMTGLIDRHGREAWLPSLPYQRVGKQLTESAFFDGPIDRRAIEACVAELASDRALPAHREIEFIPWGGAYAHDDGASAFAHRSARLLVRHTAMLGASADGALQARARAWTDASAATLRAASNGRRYQGYAQLDLLDWARAYYGDALPRLKAVKAKYDPGNVFSHRQSLSSPPAACGGSIT
jgi:FAD/FMN-containing dehydrogenase